MQIEDNGDTITVSMTRDEYFLVKSLMSEAHETGDVRDFQTRMGATMDEVASLVDSMPRLPLKPRRH